MVPHRRYLRHRHHHTWLLLCWLVLTHSPTASAAIKATETSTITATATATAATTPSKASTPAVFPLTQPCPRSDPWWQPLHAQLVAEAREADEGQGLDLAFYGDSITECWRGTGRGAPASRCQGTPTVFQRHWGGYRAEVFAISGDPTAVLMYRLLDGELLHKPPTVAVLLIGTNDMNVMDEGQMGGLVSSLRDQTQYNMTMVGGEVDAGGGDALWEAIMGVSNRIVNITNELLATGPSLHVITIGVLPFGRPCDSSKCTDSYFTWPRPMTAAITVMNEMTRQQLEHVPRAHFLDCNNLPWFDQHGNLDRGLIPDAIHPDSVGMDMLAGCIDNMLRKVAGEAAPGPGAAAWGLRGNDTTLPMLPSLVAGGDDAAASQQQVDNVGTVSLVLGVAVMEVLLVLLVLHLIIME